MGQGMVNDDGTVTVLGPKGEPVVLRPGEGLHDARHGGGQAVPSGLTYIQRLQKQEQERAAREQQAAEEKVRPPGGDGELRMVPRRGPVARPRAPVAYEATLHASTFEYLKPTEFQLGVMSHVRGWTALYAAQLEAYLPAGPDKTYILRKLRELAMWVNVSITREADGTPRVDP